MCGIFGSISGKEVNKQDLKILIKHSMQRGRDSSGLLYLNKGYEVIRADFDILKLTKMAKLGRSKVVFGHSRLITNGLSDNQPVVRNGISAIHNGIIVNEEEVWPQLKVDRKLKIDSELIVAVAEECLSEGVDIADIPEKILSLCKGTIACALFFSKLGKALLFSNNGSLYIGENSNGTYFSSESYTLKQLSCKEIRQVRRDPVCLDIPPDDADISISDFSSRDEDLIPVFKFNKNEAGQLRFGKHNLKRCTKCILPETMPFIRFDSEGVCNYCNNYKKRNDPKPKEDIFDLVAPYRRNGGADCIVPFSGGRDSSYALHLIVNELKMNPITYTYDWGMVTDLGRRNISLMCAQLGVENILVAADISKKRRNIRMNLEAWLKCPHLGLIALLTAGDKHFFRYVEHIKAQTGLKLNLWGVSPLESTHFKAGFLGIKPDFEEKRVYSHGVSKQLNYHYHRFGAMLGNLGYFNRSLWDTLSGEYYRSFTEKTDYYHVYDYWRWEEDVIDDTLDTYGWERATDTNTTWRIGDGTVAFYNYIYYTLAGFTEHDTFRSNQIREGQIGREEALALVEDENRPRYQNIRWYLDTLNMEFSDVIKRINSLPRLHDALV